MSKFCRLIEAEIKDQRPVSYNIFTGSYEAVGQHPVKRIKAKVIAKTRAVYGFSGKVKNTIVSLLGWNARV